MTIFTGIVTVEGGVVEGRTVRLHHRITGALIDETTTDGGGNYSLDSGAVAASNVVVVGIPTEVAGTVESYNGVAIDGYP